MHGPSDLAGRRWLIITEEDVFPENTGGRVDHAGFLRAASAAGIDLRVLVPAREFDAPRYSAEIPHATFVALPRRESAIHHLSLRRPYVVATRAVALPELLDAAGPVRDAVLSHSVRVAHLGEAIAREWDVPHVVRCQNLDSQYFRDLARSSRGPRRLAYAAEAWRMTRFEARLNISSHVTAFTDVSADEAARHDLNTRHRVVHVPLFALLPTDTEPFVSTERSGVVFTGSLDVETNITALTWLLTQVWPRVRAARGDATLTVVGRRPSPALRAQLARLASDGVSLAADVPEVTPYLRSASVAVNPAQSGSGMNVKLLQAMLGGAAAVTTSVGGSGMAWDDGEDLVIADSPVAFAAAVVRLLTDTATRDRIAAGGAATVRDRLDPVTNIAAIAALLEPSSVPVPQPRSDSHVTGGQPVL